MKSLELVIKIPENYDLSKIQNGSIASQMILNAVKNGTILPKGHGKIGDLDRLYHVFERNVTGASSFKQLFDMQPTIIEADR